MYIVQHQNERIALAEVGLKERNDNFIDPGHPSRQLLQELTANRPSALEGRHDAGQQNDGVVVARAELHPCAGPRIQVTPLRDKGRLPVADRRRNQHHPAALGDLLQRGEARSGHRPRQDGRNSTLWPRQQWPGLGRTQRYSSFRPLRLPVSLARATSGQARHSQVLDADMKPRCRRRRARHATWRSIVLTTNARMPIDALTVVAALTLGRDRANISDKSAPLAIQVPLPSLSKNGRPHQEMPLLAAQ